MGQYIGVDTMPDVRESVLLLSRGSEAVTEEELETLEKTLSHLEKSRSMPLTFQ